MFRAHFCALLGIGLMLAAASVQARELELSVDTRMGGDNNVFRTSRDEKADGFWELSPKVTLHTRNSKLNYDFNYTPTYSTYMKSSGIDGFDHRGQGLLSWRPTPVDTINFNASYRNVRLIREVDVTGPTDPTPVVEESDRERYQVSNVRLSYNRALNARWSVQVAGNFDDFDFSRSDSIDSRGYSGELRTQYALMPTAAVGLSGSFRRRESDSNGFSRPAEDSNIVNLAAFIQYALTPTISASVQAGPSFIDTKQDFQPTAPLNDKKDQNTSYFAFAQVEKTWQRSRARASYSRTESAGGGSSAISILDRVGMSVDYHLDRRWSARVSGSWIKRKEIVSVQNSNRQETTQFVTFFTLTHRLTRRISISGQYSARTQDQDGRPGAESIGTIHTGYVSLKYTFDPVVF